MTPAAARLLIIDDEPIIGKRLKQAFGKLGLEAASFTSPLDALRAMAEQPFDLVITDLKMEGLDGLETLRRVRALNRRAKVIIITGYPDPETAQAASREGAFAFLVKPFRLEELKAEVSRALAELSQA